MTDQLPPHSPESERACIAAAISSPVALDDARRRIKSPEVFYEPQNAACWRALCAMQDAGEAIDSTTLYRHLKDSQQLKQAGGFEYLNKIQEFCISAANQPNYVADVLDAFLRRRLMQVCSKRSGEAQESQSPAETIIEQTQGELDNLNQDQSELIDGKTASGLLTDDLERRFNLKGALSGVPTGFREFDALTDGLQYGDQSIIASRPSIGKSAIALNIFHHAAILNKIPSLFVSLEMSVAALMRRLASQCTELTMNTLRRGSYTPNDFRSLTVFTGRAGAAPVWFLDGIQGMGISALCAEVRRACRRFGIKFVIIDYLQRIKSDERHEKRTYEVGSVSTRLCGLADQTGAALLTLAQLNRENEKGEKGRMPRLSDLGDSKQIEQDADTVALLHRNRTAGDGKATLIVAKQRDGDTGMVSLKYNGSLCKFENDDYGKPNTD